MYMYCTSLLHCQSLYLSAYRMLLIHNILINVFYQLDKNHCQADFNPGNCRYDCSARI